MAQKKKASKAKTKSKSTSSAASVTRVRAVDTGRDTVKAPKKPKAVKFAAVVSDDPTPITTKKRRINPKSALRPVKATGGYFKGAWVELKQVRWPTRSATWELTGAVLLYSAFFTVLILLLDAGFKYVFELILSK